MNIINLVVKRNMLNRIEDVCFLHVGKITNFVLRDSIRDSLDCINSPMWEMNLGVRHGFRVFGHKV